MEFFFNEFNKTPIFIAVEEENIEMVKFLLSDDKTDINILNVLIE